MLSRLGDGGPRTRACVRDSCSAASICSLASSSSRPPALASSSATRMGSVSCTLSGTAKPYSASRRALGRSCQGGGWQAEPTIHAKYFHAQVLARLTHPPPPVPTSHRSSYTAVHQPKHAAQMRCSAHWLRMEGPQCRQEPERMRTCTPPYPPTYPPPPPPSLLNPPGPGPPIPVSHTLRWHAELNGAAQCVADWARTAHDSLPRGVGTTRG